MNISPLGSCIYIYSYLFPTRPRSTRGSAHPCGPSVRGNADHEGGLSPASVEALSLRPSNPWDGDLLPDAQTNGDGAAFDLSGGYNMDVA